MLMKSMNMQFNENKKYLSFETKSTPGSSSKLKLSYDGENPGCSSTYNFSTFSKISKLLSSLHFPRFPVKNEEKLNFTISTHKTFEATTQSSAVAQTKTTDSSDESTIVGDASTTGGDAAAEIHEDISCLLYTSPSPRDS